MRPRGKQGGQVRWMVVFPSSLYVFTMIGARGNVRPMGHSSIEGVTIVRYGCAKWGSVKRSVEIHAYMIVFRLG